MTNASQAEAPYGAPKGGKTHYISEKLRPVGPVMVLGPSNYPVNETLDKALSAVLLGNPVFIKTPKNAALTFGLMLQDLADSFPPGVVNVMPGSGRKTLGPAIGHTDMSGDPTFKQLTWVGGKRSFDAVRSQHPDPSQLNLYAGLAAKNPGVVLEGSTEEDLKRAVSQLVKGSLGSNGRRCTAEKVLYVHDSVADRFSQLLVAEVDKMKVDMPWAEGVDQTPLPNDWGVEAMQEYIEDAVAQGAKVLNHRGGEAFHSLMVPAVLGDVTPEMRIFQEEQFGPIVPIVRYHDLSQVREWDAASSFGQQVSLWGPEEVAYQAADLLAENGFGGVNINSKCERGPDTTPFTGARDSGVGAMSTQEVLGHYSKVSRWRSYTTLK